MSVAEVREYAGWHELDGEIQDLSPTGVSTSLAALGQGSLPADPVDAAVLGAWERAQRWSFGVLETHRRNPAVHLAALDVACYDREYAPAEDRASARARHLAAWPDAVDAAISALDRVPAPAARATLRAVRGLGQGVDDAAALAALERLVAHLEQISEQGEPSAALGEQLLVDGYRHLEALDLDLARLTELAEAETERLLAMLIEACARLRPGMPAAAVVAELLAEAPTTAEEVYAAATESTREVREFALSSGLLPDLGGEVVVGPAPASRSLGQAMMSWAAPYEPDAPSCYYVVPPDPNWPADEQRQWLSVFSPTALPTICAHEVTPGHFTHGRAMRRLDSDVRRTLMSAGFIEGWAHHAEEVYVELGFRGHDPRYTIGVALEALLRATRLTVSVGLHSGAMTVDEAQGRFEIDAFMQGAAARGEAWRGTVDPFYGIYTLGKLTLRSVRERARDSWGAAYDEQRFHTALLDLGAPPLGLVEAALLAPDTLTAG